MEIKIVKLKITHFKGIKSLDVNFKDLTNISGENASGKTTVMDAFLWLLFGKDSTDRKEFEIKPISLNGNSTPKDVEVEGTLIIDSKKLVLKRVYREKWQKKRGSAEAEFTGHESTFFVNEVPCTQKEYNEKISLIIHEETFKMLTNPAYFPSLKWQTQREIIFQMAGGELPDSLIAEGKPEFKDLIAELEGKTLDEYKRQIANHKRRLRDEIEHIPSRIDEVERSLPEDQDWKEIEKSIKTAEKELLVVEGAITDKSKAYEKAYEARIKVQDDLYAAKHKLREIIEKARVESEKGTRDHEEKNHQTEEKIRQLSRDLEVVNVNLSSLRESSEKNEKERLTLRDDWHRINNSSIEEKKCPTCGQEVHVDEAEFNTLKAQQLESVTTLGREKKANYDHLTEKTTKAEERRQDIASQIDQLKKSVTPPIKPVFNEELIPGAIEAKKIIDALEDKYNTPIEQPDTDSLKEDKATIREIISVKGKELSNKDVIEKGRERIKELEKQQQTLAQEMADLERVEFTIFNFEKAKVQAIEQQVNGMFDMAKWKLFETQVNGQEVPCCVATYQNVPYSDLNNAARINIGIDIINTLCRFHDIQAPIWVDNSESINEIRKPSGQLIRLVVSKDPELVIETI